MTQATRQQSSDTGRPGWTRLARRWLPAAALLLLAVAGYGLGLHHHLSLTALAENRDLLRNWVDAHLALALAAFMLAYVAVVALSIPGAAVMSIAGGFLFGWPLSVPATVVSAVAGAAIVFQIVKTSFGAALAERSGPFLERLSRGFAAHAFSLLLFLRLTPVFPFWAVNAVAGLSRIPFRTFILATAVGILPASLAFALVGAGLDRTIEAQLAAYRACVGAQGEAPCRLGLEASALLSTELVLGLSALGLVALVPVAIRLWRGGGT
ncbi:TVP38/TMEM64 family protein [Aestuariivirga sp.]|uniref:TVP38/TMEM64 family protein n=1 Tax=Aestuariivirga sp. TaxID=2650926 RepID=UPI00391C2A66